MRFDHENRSRLSAEARTLNKNAVFDALAASGLDSVLIEFDGCVGNRRMLVVCVETETRSVALPTTSVVRQKVSDDGQTLTTDNESLSDAMENLCYDYLAEHHNGWDIDDGSCGSFGFDVSTRVITLEFTLRMTEFCDEKFWKQVELGLASMSRRGKQAGPTKPTRDGVDMDYLGRITQQQ